MQLIENNETIQTLPFQTADQSFTGGIGFRRAFGRVLDFNPRASSHSRELGAQLAIIVLNQILGSLVKGCALTVAPSIHQ